MQVLHPHATGFVPYSGGGVGGAQAHINRVIADGGQGVDGDTVTAFFNLFPSQQLPASMLSFTDPFLGYKLDSYGRIIRLYSATGAAGDAVAIEGVYGPVLLGSTLNGRPGLSYANAALKIAGLELSPADEWAVFGVVNDFLDGRAFSYVPGYGTDFNLTRLYDNLTFNFSPYFSGPQFLLPAYVGPNNYNRFYFSWAKYQAPSEMVGIWNGAQQQASANTGADKHFFGVSDFMLGNNSSTQIRLNSFGLLSAQELAYRPVIDNFLKTYYGFSV